VKRMLNTRERNSYQQIILPSGQKGGNSHEREGKENRVKQRIVHTSGKLRKKLVRYSRAAMDTEKSYFKKQGV